MTLFGISLLLLLVYILWSKPNEPNKVKITQNLSVVSPGLKGSMSTDNVPGLKASSPWHASCENHTVSQLRLLSRCKTSLGCSPPVNWPILFPQYRSYLCMEIVFIFLLMAHATVVLKMGTITTQEQCVLPRLTMGFVWNMDWKRRIKKKPMSK